MASKSGVKKSCLALLSALFTSGLLVLQYGSFSQSSSTLVRGQQCSSFTFTCPGLFSSRTCWVSASKLTTSCRLTKRVMGNLIYGLRNKQISTAAVADDQDELLPFGPFCPIFSKSFMYLVVNTGTGPDYRARMEGLVNRMDKLASDGNPNLQEHLDLSNQLREADSVWQGNLFNIRYANDFQTQELYHFTDVYFRHLGLSISELFDFATWQADVLLAMAGRRTMPETIVEPLSDKALQLKGILNSMRVGGPLAVIFDSKPFPSIATPVVQEELHQLEMDHMSLVQFGQRYEHFDSGGKKLYLDQLDNIAERWRAYFARVRLTGAELPGYVTGSLEQVKRLGLTGRLASELVQKAHSNMRLEVDD